MGNLSGWNGFGNWGGGIPGSESFGIRPGEKLHEVLITKEEAKHTIELDNYYVILPEDKKKNIKENLLANNGKELHRDFIYSSDLHEDCLTKEDLLKIISEIKLWYPMVINL